MIASNCEISQPNEAFLLSLPFLSFFHKGSRQKLSHIPVSGLIRADTVNQSLSFERS
jgi:hypothetical protein